MTDLVVPTLGESITEAVIGKWLVEVGEHVGADEPVVDLETDKITIQLPAPTAGALTEQKYAEGDTVQVGDVVGMIDSSVSAPPPAADLSTQGSEPATPAKSTQAKSASAKSASAKSASAKSASAKSASATPIPERDESGRVLSPSQRRLIREGKALAPVARTAVVVSTPREAKEEIVPMSPLRRRIAERLVQAQQSTASLTTFNEVDMSCIIEMRKHYKEDFLAEHGVKLGFMSFAVKASVAALKLFPGVNAELRDNAIVYKKRYDLGIAVGTERGLVVPVLRDCDALGFADIEQGIVDLALKARTNKLVLDDLMGGTFTITNGGIFGSMMSTPLLNFPQTGILGLHNIIKRPVAVGDEVAVRPMMYLALTYDHRVVDGSSAVQFLVAVKERMEKPERLLFGV